MAETLLALLLVTTSSRESSLVFRWPPSPMPSPRLARAPPDKTMATSRYDDPWRASHQHESQETLPNTNPDYGNDPDYAWQRPNALRDRLWMHHGGHRSSSGRISPTRDRAYSLDKVAVPDEYDHVLGYRSGFLAGILCPDSKAIYHQKFELVVDDLAFVGHPVCVDSDGQWKFRPEKVKSLSRGRETLELEKSMSPQHEESSLSPEMRPLDAGRKSSLKAFHLVLVVDLPDPSSSASGNISKYFNVLYEQIAFTMTAVLYQEQVLSRFVEKECDAISVLKEQCITKGEPFSNFVDAAFEASSIPLAMKTLYEAIKTSSIANLNINYLPLELQLPPYLDTLLHSKDDQEVDELDSDEEDLLWPQEMNLGWKLPRIAPWKSLLLLDPENDVDVNTMLHGPYDDPEDRNFAESLARFLEAISITLSLNDMALLLDSDLETQIYPIVRWLVLHRRAKVVDVVHPALKTVFTLPPKFNEPLSKLASQFNDAFSHPAILPLPKILEKVSLSASKPADNHFFATVVHNKEFIPMYHDVVAWMLKRDMLVTLHLRIRLVATRELKLHVKAQRDYKLSHKSGKSFAGRGRAHRDLDDLDEEDVNPDSTTFYLSPHAARRFTRRISSPASGKSEMSELDFGNDDRSRHKIESDESELEEEEDSGWDTSEDHFWPSMINDPGKATPMQRRWLTAMSEGKDPVIAKRFELINQYFDGKRSDDEILYRADISRKQLREVLHHYDEYLQTFLHPS